MKFEDLETISAGTIKQIIQRIKRCIHLQADISSDGFNTT